MTPLSPLGILLPKKFRAGAAWGEWGPEELEKLVGYIPQGLKKWAELWRAPLPDYNLGGEGASLTVQVISYIVSGLIGIVIVGLLVYGISRMIVRSGNGK
jgi:hypothetical protein